VALSRPDTASAINAEPLLKEPASQLSSVVADDELANFFDEVAQSAAVAVSVSERQGATADRDSEGAATPAIKDETILTEKYTSQDLGDSAFQLKRLTAPNYAWRNLNPYEVLQLDVDATLEDIKYRYLFRAKI
jgi:hypothetical protein